MTFTPEELEAHDELVRQQHLEVIRNDPATKLFGRSIAEVQRALNLCDASRALEAWTDGFNSAIDTVKRVAERHRDQMESLRNIKIEWPEVKL